MQNHIKEAKFAIAKRNVVFKNKYVEVCKVKFPIKSNHHVVVVNLPKKMSATDVETMFGFNMGESMGLDSFKELLGVSN